MSDLAKKLSHVYWIGGSPCAGKTSVARMLKEKYGFIYYKADDEHPAHVERSTEEQHPNMNRSRHLTWGEYWSARFSTVPVPRQVEESIGFYEEQFSMVVEDLLALPDTSPVLVEGSVVLPKKVAPLLADPNRAIWLFPTPDFQVKHYSQREWIHHILKLTEDPDLAFQGWMEKEMGFARSVRESVKKYGFESIQVDDSKSLKENFDAVRTHFDLH
ncbi:hypothetical protein [Indiicoccus explosivorum]|uniref:hypothetical protein n=1 Tax=Indiicoccus explosivorum TaxID=1917864 RepID=UPI000B4435D7|nr:hypothetical protein [Indiicoccus explosivorum]